jgi:hypothetical protein
MRQQPLQPRQAEDIAAAVRLLAQAASQQLGSDCIRHAELALHLLERDGLSGALAAGHAAWRLHGADPGAVVAHHPDGKLLPETRGMAFHAWIEIGDWVFDTTTYQLRGKMAQIDAADGHRTAVAWAPDFVLAPTVHCQPWAAVRDGFRAGACCYERVPALEARIRRCPPIDGDHLRCAEWILKAVRSGNPVQVIGPSRWAGQHPNRQQH